MEHLIGTLAEAALDTAPFGADDGPAQGLSACSRNDDQIHTRRQEIRPSSKAIPTNSLDAVSHDAVAYLLAQHEPQPRGKRRRLGVSLRGDEEREMRRSDSDTHSLRANEFRVAAQPAVAPERIGRHDDIARPWKGYFL